MDALAGERILITGANGSIGRALQQRLDGFDVLATDIDSLDVRSALEPTVLFAEWKPTVIIHLAAAKHAPQGELDPEEVSEVNIRGTANILAAARTNNRRVVLTSTCKAADPETAYGASKLIAERMVLNAGGTVARLYNVVEASGNVFETWAALPADEPLPVTPCERYFISIDQAVDLVLRCATLPSGRYTVNPGAPRRMDQVARQHYPGRAQTLVPPRRGDRLAEPLFAHSEYIAWAQDDGLWRIESKHDPVDVRERMATAVGAQPYAA